MKAKAINLSRAAVLGWIVANALGFGIEFLNAYLPSNSLVQDFFLRNAAILINSTPGSLLIGLVLGLAQWLALQRSIPDLRLLSWVAATAIGQVIGYIGASGIFFALLFGSIFTGSSGIELGAIGALMVMGLCLGVFQWFIIRKYLPNGAWWILINVVGQGIGRLSGVVLLMAMAQLHVAEIALAVVSGICAGAIFGIVSIAGLNWLMNPARYGPTAG